MKRTLTTSTTFSGTYVSAKQIKEFLEGIPDDAKINVSTYSGDQREGGTTTYRASWQVG
jgi:hypothetical protein